MTSSSINSTTYQLLDSSNNVIPGRISYNSVNLTATFVLMRVGLLAALVGSYEGPGLAFWLSPFADPLAVFRVLLSSVRRPRAWRGRQYAA